MPINEDPDPNPTTDLLDWLEDSVSFLPPFLDDPYNTNEINSYPWWDQNQYGDQEQDPINASSSSLTTFLNTPPSSDSSKKRKQPHNPTHKTQQQQQRKRNENRVEEDDEETPRKLISMKKQSGGKTSSNSHNNNGNNKDARWAEQLLNPCASAITSGNLSRVQHLLYVLHELASLSGDPNHRLAAHGLRALTRHLSQSPSLTSTPSPTFISTEPRLFQNSLIKFHELSPWFSFPNSLANASILQTLTLTSPDSDRRRPDLHILDIGVSHGVQWPTLLEALTRRTGGPPALVRLTVVGSGDPSDSASFSAGPPGDDFPSRLLRFAKRIDLNLQINRIDGQKLQTLTSETLGVSNNDETLIVCAQFRLHQLNHGSTSDRIGFLQKLRDLDPDLVVLSENDGDCSCNNCGDFATGFSRRVEFLWRFLDSTSVAFKGRECEERRVVEGEAATVLVSGAEMNEGREGWSDKMRGVGFIRESFGEDATDGGRALLRKYDSNWEMRVDEHNGCVCLCWKGQPVSFCSLWKLPPSARKKGGR
ncbi:GRAS family transcription factor [Tasmannia lanceolata]|uniref:GRAS family transcription factor n=1 Tax=Tasmannia lanceolata TaxID=3420 RepID=UPI004062D2F0